MTALLVWFEQLLFADISLFLAAVLVSFQLNNNGQLNFESEHDKAMTTKSEEQTAALLVSQIISVAEAEFILTTDELNKISAIIAHAGESLAGNYTGLQEESISQKDLVEELVSKLAVLVHDEQDISNKTSDFSQKSNLIYQRMLDSINLINRLYLKLIVQN